ncbi:hypothetical protein G7046_g4826 [Stylonectria norvegica]|nr:hypothetical protein G7046_g4826 [Stylonectria norvegica]
MAQRRVYLAKSRTSTQQRSHFGIFIPNAVHADKDLTNLNFRSSECSGTIIHVVGEPVMAGYALEFKRNYDASRCPELKMLVPLGLVDVGYLYEPVTPEVTREDTPRAVLEREAVRVTPPPRGQNVRAVMDGVNTRRCQEWTMEYLTRLVEKKLIDPTALAIAQKERDPPDHGIFGIKAARAVQSVDTPDSELGGIF